MNRLPGITNISVDMKYGLIVVFFTFLFLQHVFSQNKACSFDYKTYYFESSIGIDKNAERQTINFLLKTVYNDYKSRFDQNTFNRIISRCGIIKTCQASNNQTTAYVLRSSCKSCFTCQPNISVDISNISDNNVRIKIQINASDFFNELYCAFDQNSSLKSNKFQINTNTIKIIEKIWELTKFRCSDLSISREAMEIEDGYRIEHIPVLLGNSEENNEEIALSFDKNGTINDFSFMTITHAYSKKISQKFIANVNIFMERFRTACIIKDSVSIMKLLLGENPPTLSDSQKEYLSKLKQSIKVKGFTNYSLDDIEVCPIINDQTIYGVSIYHKYSRDGKTSNLGYLTLLLELQNQANSFLVNSFKASIDKLDPCFP